MVGVDERNQNRGTQGKGADRASVWEIQKKKGSLYFGLQELVCFFCIYHCHNYFNCTGWFIFNPVYAYMILWGYGDSEFKEIQDL